MRAGSPSQENRRAAAGLQEGSPCAADSGSGDNETSALPPHLPSPAPSPLPPPCPPPAQAAGKIRAAGSFHTQLGPETHFTTHPSER